MNLDWSMLQGSELFYRLLGLVLFVGPVVGLVMYTKIRGPVKTNFSRTAGVMEQATAILVPGLLLIGLMLMIMGTPGGGPIGSPTP
jgi:hypothetical protein